MTGTQYGEALERRIDAVRGDIAAWLEFAEELGWKVFLEHRPGTDRALPHLQNAGRRRAPGFKLRLEGPMAQIGRAQPGARLSHKNRLLRSDRPTTSPS